MEPTLLDQILSTIGALLVLGAYTANLAHRLDRDGPLYAGCNLVGAGLLAWAAVQSGALGLILVEVAWALVSAVALARSVGRHGTRR